MAEYLIYNKTHEWDSLEPWEIDIISQKDPSFITRYNGRYKKGDIVEEKPDGYWSGKNGKSFRKDVFALVCRPGIQNTGQYALPEKDLNGKFIKNRRYRIETADKVLDSDNKITVTEIEFETLLENKTEVETLLENKTEVAKIG